MLARHYAWEKRGLYHGIWWLRAEAQDTLLHDLIQLGRRIGLHFPAKLKSEDAARQTLDAVAQTRASRPWLLVYDNVEDKALVRRLTPPENAHILYTTRLRNWLGEADELPVDVFPLETAIEFLLAYAKNETRETAGQLAEALGCLPLALTHARAYCQVRKMSFDHYREQFTELLRSKTKSSDYDHEKIYATFSLAMDRATEECASALRLMGLIAHFAPDQIPLWLIPEMAMPETERDDALEALQRLSLVTHDAEADGAPAISVHRLVQEVVRARLHEAGEAENYAAQAVTALYDAYDFYADTHEIHRRRTAWLPHALASLTHAPREGDAADSTIWVCNYIGDFRRSRGELSRASEAYETGMKIGKELADASPENTTWQRDLSVSYNKVGDVLVAQGNLPEALKAFRDSLDIRERLAKADPNNAGWQADLAASHGKLGQLYAKRGDKAEAMRLFKAGRAIVAPLAEKSGHQLWQSYVRFFDAQIAALDAESAAASAPAKPSGWFSRLWGAGE